MILIQNPHHALLSDAAQRLELYRAVLRRRLEQIKKAGTAKPCLKAPRLRGLRLRLPGKPFHSTPEIFLQEGGETRFELPHETLTARAGDVLIVPAGMPHGERWRGKRFLNLIVMFQSKSFSIHLGYLKEGKGTLHSGPVDLFPSVERFPLQRYAEELAEMDATDAKDPASRHIRQGLHLALLARLLQGLRPSIPASSEKNPWLLRCKEMIAVHACRMDFSVVWLARELRCSPDHLSRRFRAQTGLRIIESIHRQRIDHARSLLRNSDMNIAEIGWACGFSQPSYFNRVFRTLTNMTPLEFRRSA